MPYRYAVYRLARLLLYMLFILIWISSIFFYIDYRFYLNGEYTGNYNWLTSSECTTQVLLVDGAIILNSTDLITTYPNMWYIWLNYSIYWSLQTVSKVGFGDITPKNPPSAIFTTISMLIMIFFFVYFINTIIEIIG
jgi:hypothetical protein